jgi:hypothetical protein
MPRFTILIPTFDHEDTIQFPLNCLREQTRQDYEVFIIGDGVGTHMEGRLRALAEKDPRITFLSFPKHPSRGEPHRHQVLLQAKGEIVCYLTDRDLWMPNHLEEMERLLESADFAHSLGLHIMPGDEFKFFPVELNDSFDRWSVQCQQNRIPLSCSAHRMEFYRRLPRGWETTPKGKPTDWHMFQQFLEHPDCRVCSGVYPSALTFPSPPRLGLIVAQRLDELSRWKERISTPEKSTQLTAEILQMAVRNLHAERANFHRSPAWRIGDALLRITGARRLKKLIG